MPLWEQALQAKVQVGSQSGCEFGSSACRCQSLVLRFNDSRRNADYRRTGRDVVNHNGVRSDFCVVANLHGPKHSCADTDADIVADYGNVVVAASSTDSDVMADDTVI